MLYPAIENIQRVLNDNIDRTVTIANIAEIISDKVDITDVDVIISLVNIEEVRLARDHQYVVKIGDELLPKKPAVHLNLSLLFTAHGAGYEQDIRTLQEVVSFFQRKAVFDKTNTPTLIDDGLERLMMEMVTLNIEQLQQLWSMLGGRYQPSVLYKMRMVTIDSVETNPIAPIKQIEAYYKNKN
ncbi:DUF4255 domain-containing protein [Parapedobacter tibetensis]|uniref:DUF4255 domain-containing protein n=1 Tax=Parapedobacter tibetensis TaxID=2972951 RepID=UPI00214DB1CB|nr:DUF4255 domain-containing protein [Parapedobacter tibetensis]